MTSAVIANRRYSFAGHFLFILLPVLLMSGCPTNNETAELPDVVIEQDLGITPIAQSLTNWCWLASGEMVFRHYNIPPVNTINYQCGVLAMLAGPGSQCWQDCRLCNVTAPSIAHIHNMMVGYPYLANQYFGGGVPQLQALWTTNPLSDAQMMDQLDANMPIIVGVSASGFRFSGQVSEHAVVIVGYGLDENEVYFLVNDPWPYGNFDGQQNPYFAGGGIQKRAGQYLISSAGLRQRLVLREAVYNIRIATNADKERPISENYHPAHF